MDFFLDSAIIDEVKSVYDLGLLDGVTTNPSLIAGSKQAFKEVIKNICNVASVPVSAEVLSTDLDQMLKEAEELCQISPNVVIKIPLIESGLRLLSILSKKGIRTNVTLCFSVNQALIAAKLGATYISPFIGRLDDTGYDGVSLIEDIRLVYDNYNFSTKVLAASIRHPLHMQQVAQAGADVATFSYKLISSLYSHPLTDVGLKKFLQDAQNISWG